MNKGVVKNSVYMKYFRAGGSWISCSFLLFLFVMSQVALSGNDYWVAYWTNAEFIREKAKHNNLTIDETNIWINNTFMSQFELDSNGIMPSSLFIYFYTFTIIMVILTNYVKCFYFVNVVSKASFNLHNSMFKNVLRTTMHFFNVNPSGE